MENPEVIVVGGGPIGLTLAIDLGRRGVSCLLMDKRPEPLFLPKMERCHSRTMEIFRRLGVSKQVRAEGWPYELDLDGFLVTTLQDEPIVRWPKPSAAAKDGLARETRDGSGAAEPYQVISQYTLEPVLKRTAEATPGVTVRFGCEVVGIEERDHEVAITFRDLDGTEGSVAAAYLAGCDGAASITRKAIGGRLEGEPNVGEQYQALFYAEDLYDRLPESIRGEHYHVADDRWSFLIVQDDRKHFTLHSRVDDPDEMPRIFERVVGVPVTYKTLWVGPWTMRLMLADRYASTRIFLAGDSAHLVTPVGGLGMNTGIGDATDLAWKLAATLRGWAGPGVLASYEVERRHIGARNVGASRRAFDARSRWREVLEEMGGVRSPEALDRLRHVAYEEQRRGSTDIAGIIQGYRYLRSPIIVAEDGDDGADQERFDYQPSTRPGARLPNLWWPDGTPMQDHVPDGYALIACEAVDARGIAGLVDAFAAMGCPFSVVDVRAVSGASEVYERSWVLVRPDLHVVWRGDRLPADPAALVGIVTGRSTPATGVA